MDIIKVQKREPGTKTNALRRQGRTPGTLYGGEFSPSVSISMDAQDAARLARLMRVGSKLRLSLEGRTVTVQIKEKAVNALNGAVENLSFQALSAGQKVNSVIHILVKNADTVPGTLERMLFELPYASLPEDMIDTVTVDLEGMPTGTVITVADIPELRCEGVELQTEPDSIVLRINDKKRAAQPMGGGDAD